MKLTKWINLCMVGCAVLMGTVSCDDDNNGNGELQLSTPTLTEITAPTATATAEVIVNQDDIDLGNIRVMSYGFCYGTKANPTIYDATVKVTPANGKMTAELDGLEDNTLYHVRAFATLYPDGVVYSADAEMIVGVLELLSETEIH